MSDNVIDFDAARVKLMEEKFDKLTEETMSEEDFIADFGLTVACDVLDAMIDFGFDPMENPDTIKDVFATIEVLRGLLHRAKSTDHPFQQISDSMFENMFEEPPNTEELLTKFMTEMEIGID